MDANGKLETWAVVEAMGFKKLAGHVTEQEVAGSALIRVDVPETADENGERKTSGYCKLIGVGSIYMITPCDEATARKAARSIELSNVSPLPVYIPPDRPQLAPASSSDTLTDLDDDGGSDGLWDVSSDVEEELQRAE